MRLPKFTAEASLYRVTGEYAGLSTGIGRPSNRSVTAQFDFTTVSADTWGWLAHTNCDSPGCQWDGFRCHCITDLFPGVR
jgi:hypothetical protein